MRDNWIASKVNEAKNELSKKEAISSAQRETFPQSG
jgi:hypothetical protein